jgi:hypothetical protein
LRLEPALTALTVVRLDATVRAPSAHHLAADRWIRAKLKLAAWLLGRWNVLRMVLSVRQASTLAAFAPVVFGSMGGPGARLGASYQAQLAALS